MCQYCQEREDNLIEKAIIYKEKKKDFRKLPDPIKKALIKQWRIWIRKGLACPEEIKNRKPQTQHISLKDGGSMCVETRNGSVRIIGALVGGQDVLVDEVHISPRDGYLYSGTKGIVIMASKVEQIPGFPKL